VGAEISIPEAAGPSRDRGTVNTVLFSSRSHQWETPKWLFDLLDAEFNFERDVCATRLNAKCSEFFSPEVDGLKQHWQGVCWMNPPYGREIGRWVEKAYRSSLSGATVVALLPARVETSWWFNFVLKAQEIRFVKGRLRFGKAQSSAPFPSAIVIFTPGKPGKPRVRFVDLAQVQRTLFGS
jgi:phage N-6-adenine-methyltransferase